MLGCLHADLQCPQAVEKMMWMYKAGYQSPNRETISHYMEITADHTGPWHTSICSHLSAERADLLPHNGNAAVKCRLCSDILQGREKIEGLRKRWSK